MQKFRNHPTFKIATFCLVLAFLTPTAIKFSHIFNHHKHEVCHDESQAHLHTKFSDCSFNKFKLTTTFAIPAFTAEFISYKHHKLTSTAHSLFLDAYHDLHFSLRGPPRFI